MKTEITISTYRLNDSTVESMKPVETKLCQSCKKRPAQQDHQCPFKAEIHEDKETLCNCCEECVQECMWDI